MMKSAASCSHPTKLAKRWPYEEYYVGEKDEEKRKAGEGEHHWTGAESLESYSGNFLQDTMHGLGVYRWRYKGPEGIFATYEGNFYGNTMHGYGVMSYDDGRYFTGLFHHNLRWGPGIESHARIREDVGLWRGNQLLRLTWRPNTSSVALDLAVTPNGNACIVPHRKMLTVRNKIVREVNSAIDLLKQCGSQPLSASENWKKLYPKNCNDLASAVCNVKAFEHEYYDGKIRFLEEVNSPPILESTEDNGSEDNATYYAWNNNETYIHMMKHCFKHEKQRSYTTVPLESILAGPRTEFKMAGKYELDCRTALMSSYLGHVTNVVQLVNECNVHPDVTDIQGNNCIMYAACGDQTDIINFLKEAGGNINAFNDCCVTPLGISIMRYLCTQWDITASGMLQALLPPPVTPIAPPEELLLEWNITRDILTESQSAGTAALASKATPPKRKTTLAIDVESARRKTITGGKQTTDANIKDFFSEEMRLYNNVHSEYVSRVNDLFSIPTTMSPIPYIFETKDMIAEIELHEVDNNKKTPVANPKKNTSKVIKPSRSTMWQSSKVEMASVDDMVKKKMETLSCIMSTIDKLLSDGADPRLVRCPQPAMFLAVMSCSSELVKRLSDHGADVNEKFPQYLGYSALDIAISQPLSNETLNLARTLLECGAKCKHRLKYESTKGRSSVVKGVPEAPIPGPTLLHAVLAKNCDSETDTEIRQQFLELLLQYNCDPILRYKGRSAIDVAINKNIELIEAFVKCPKTDMNAVINDSNETVLLKMFIMPFCNTIPLAERLMILTNLLLYGADPFLPCIHGEELYKNLFVYTRRILNELTDNVKPIAPTTADDLKSKKSDTKSAGKRKMSFGLSKMGADIIGNYSQAVDLIVECARILLVRWLQANLYVELLDIVKRYKHRNWHMIIREHKNKRTCGLWLSSLRCIELWDIMKTNKKAPTTVDDRAVLKQLLCIVKLYCEREYQHLNRRVTTEEKNFVEEQVKYIIYEHKNAEALVEEEVPWTRSYVTPELNLNCAEKYNVCFDCLLPLEDDAKVLCCSCKLVAFCGFDCMKENIERAGCHPCSEYLRVKYFPSPTISTEYSETITNTVRKD